MNILRHIILVLILWTFPSFALAYISPGFGSALSYFTFLLLMGYYVLEPDKSRPFMIFIVLGLAYFLIGGLQYDKINDKDFFISMIKYMVIIVAGGQLIKKTSLKSIYIILLLGALCVSVHAIFFPMYNANFSPSYGRYSGFYLNPNYAGAICLVCFAMSFGINNKILRLTGQIIATFGGIFTFSRYFIVIWVLLNIISVFINRKNIIAPVIGALALFLIIAFSSMLQLNSTRFDALMSILDDRPIKTEVIGDDSRTHTWLTYKDIILDKPLTGNGFKTLYGNNFGLSAGVHNTYLLVIGEAGIIPFIILIYLYLWLLIRSFKHFKSHPHNFMLGIVLLTALMVTHNYFDKFSILLISIYLYNELTKIEEEQNENYY